MATLQSQVSSSILQMNKLRAQRDKNNLLKVTQLASVTEEDWTDLFAFSRKLLETHWLTSVGCSLSLLWLLLVRSLLWELPPYLGSITGPMFSISGARGMPCLRLLVVTGRCTALSDAVSEDLCQHPLALDRDPPPCRFRLQRCICLSGFPGLKKDLDFLGPTSLLVL